MEFTYSKIYLVTDEDYELLKEEVGVPKKYEQLSVCENNSQKIIDKIEEGTDAAFMRGELLPWCYTVPDGNPHSHQFIKVPAGCNQNVAASIQIYSEQIINQCQYLLQKKYPPHMIGKSSWSIIFSDTLKEGSRVSASSAGAQM
jgi:hypothetical protein